LRYVRPNVRIASRDGAQATGTYTISLEVGVGAEEHTTNRRRRRFLCVGEEQKSAETDRLGEYAYARSGLDGVAGIKLDGRGDLAVPAVAGLPVIPSSHTSRAGRHSCGDVERAERSDDDS
jgi:hypothetical protein